MIQLMQHQAKAVDIARRNPRYGFFFDCGTGKTITMLAVIADRPLKTVVVCPKSIIDAAWLRDAQHFPQINVISGRAPTPHRRRELISSRYDAIVMNYEMFVKHTEDLLLAGCQRVVFDESSALKAWKTARTKACVAFANNMRECYVLSGTPAPNGEHEYWAQLRCISPTRVPSNYYRFCNAYMVPQKRTFGGQECVTGWRLIPNRRAAFESLLKECSWALRKEECVDLPPRMDEFREVELSVRELETYLSIKTLMQAEIEGNTISAAQGATLMKLRQITGGWMYGEGKVAYDFGDSKLGELLAVLEEIGPQPVVIWAEFSHDIDRIDGVVRGAGRRPAILDGRTPDRDRAEIITRFGSDPDTLVCHPKAVGHGVTLTAASYAVYFNTSYSYELYHQSKDRIHRIGQSRPCTYIHLVARETCDQRVIEVLQRKGTSHEAMLAALTDGEDWRKDGHKNRHAAARA